MKTTPLKIKELLYQVTIATYYTKLLLLTVLNKPRTYQVIWSHATQSITVQTFPIRC